MLKNYFITAIRAFKRYAVYGSLNIMGLALGIACAALIFLWVEDELSFDRQYPKHNDIYTVRMNMDFSGKRESFDVLPGPMPALIKQTVPEVINQSRAGFSRELFSIADKQLYEWGIYVDTGFFSMMQLPFLKGSAAGFTNPHSLVLSAKMAEQFFGTTDAVGKTLQVNNDQPFVVIGVIKDVPPNSSMQFNFLAPVDNFLQRNRWLNSWETYGINTILEFKPGVDLTAVSNKLTAILRSKAVRYAHSECILWSMNDWHLRNNYTNGKPDGGQIKYVRLFSIIAWIILFIACINFMNLSTARAGLRAREIGVRKSLGAFRYSLIGQFIMESLVLSFVAVMVAVILVYMALPGFNVLVQKQLVFEPLAPVHLVGLLAIGILCGLLAGSYPAFYLSSFDPVKVLKGLRVGQQASAGFIRKGLVVTQFAVSIILIVCTMIIYQQIRHIKSRDLGYNKQHLIYFNATGNVAKHFETMRAELQQTGAVEEAALAFSPPTEMWATVTSGDLTWAGSDPTNKIKIHWEGATPHYLTTMGMQLKEGRGFHADVLSDTNNVIINESLARIMGKAGQVGTMIQFQHNKPYQVIGVVKDFVFNNVYASVTPLMLSTNTAASGGYNVMNIRLRAGAALTTALAQVEAIVKKYNPGYPFEYRFVDERFDQLFSLETRVEQLAGVFAALAIVISCLGLFGLAAFTAERRSKEIGIRKVLGASASGLVSLLTREFLQLVVISCLIAFPLAWWAMNGWLNDYAYRTSIHWWVFGLAGILAVAIALFTVSFQAIRGALANPVKTLRSE